MTGAGRRGTPAPGAQPGPGGDAPGTPSWQRQLYAAAFHGAPAPPGLPVADAPGLDPRTRWLAGVYLGGLGLYGAAADLLLPGGRPAGSLAASARASHLRQLGRHAEAEALDRWALARATPADPAAPPTPDDPAARATPADPPTPEDPPAPEEPPAPDGPPTPDGRPRQGDGAAAARADALIGLVADAVGLGRLALARRRLARAGRALAADRSWRTAVRLDWVRAEVALLGGRPAEAVAAATAALRRAQAADAPRHAAKSLLILGAAVDVRDGATAAVPLLQQAAAAASARGLLPIVWPSRLLLARLLHSSDTEASSHERLAAASAICALRWGLPAAETATLLARPEIRPLVGRTTVSARVPPTRSPVRITVGTTQSQTRG